MLNTLIIFLCCSNLNSTITALANFTALLAQVSTVCSVYLSINPRKKQKIDFSSKTYGFIFNSSDEYLNCEIDLLYATEIIN